MVYDFSLLQTHIAETQEWLKNEFSAIRTGRATPSIIDGVKINSYGTKIPIAHVAGVTIEDARTLRITPWDKTQIKEIGEAIIAANLGPSISVDDAGIRVTFPELTSERREGLVKVLKAKGEEARISLRGFRDEVWSDIQKKEKAGEMPEDDKFRLKDEMQKFVEEGNNAFVVMIDKKEKELLS